MKARFGGTGGRAISESFTAVPTADDESDLIDGDGNTTDLYNDTSAGVTATFLNTNLGRVDQVDVSVASVTANAVDANQVIAEARPAVPGDFNNDEDYVDGSIVIMLVNAGSGGEVGNDTDITDMEFNVTVLRQ